mgnify:CR=1 FL=1
MESLPNPKKFTKKLELNKKTVEMLNKKEMSVLKGGNSTTYCTCSYCVPQGGCTAYKSWQGTYWTSCGCY